MELILNSSKERKGFSFVPQPTFTVLDLDFSFGLASCFIFHHPILLRYLLNVPESSMRHFLFQDQFFVKPFPYLELCSKFGGGPEYFEIVTENHNVELGETHHVWADSVQYGEEYVWLLTKFFFESKRTGIMANLSRFSCLNIMKCLTQMTIEQKKDPKIAIQFAYGWGLVDDFRNLIQTFQRKGENDDDEFLLNLISTQRFMITDTMSNRENFKSVLKLTLNMLSDAVKFSKQNIGQMLLGYVNFDSKGDFDYFKLIWNDKHLDFSDNNQQQWLNEIFIFASQRNVSNKFIESIAPKCLLSTPVKFEFTKTKGFVSQSIQTDLRGYCWLSLIDSKYKMIPTDQKQSEFEWNLTKTTQHLQELLGMSKQISDELFSNCFQVSILKYEGWRRVLWMLRINEQQYPNSMLFWTTERIQSILICACDLSTNSELLDELILKFPNHDFSANDNQAFKLALSTVSHKDVVANLSKKVKLKNNLEKRLLLQNYSEFSEIIQNIEIK